MPVKWAVRGFREIGGASFLRVRAECVLVLECQRCLEGFDWSIDVDRTLEVVDSEEAAEAGLAEADPEAVERIVGSRRFDLAGLIEDEIILAMPYVPKHDICPRPPASAAGSETDTSSPSPFAALGKMKKH